MPKLHVKKKSWTFDSYVASSYDKTDIRRAAC